MHAINKIANKLANPANTTQDGRIVDAHTTTTASIPNGTALVSENRNMKDGKVVGFVDEVEYVPVVKKVPIIETTRTVEVLPTVERLPAHVDHKTIVADTVVEETIRTDLLTQVQPVVHKEIEKEEVHHITKHINEARAPSVAGTVTLAPVVEEHVHTHIVDEIHPVIHREIVEQDVKLVEDHKKEHIIAPAIHKQEVITENIVAPHHVKLAPVVESVPRHVDLAASTDHKTIVTDAVVDEHIRKDLLTQVQPVIHKEIEKEEVHHITKHINEAPAPSVAGTVTLRPVVEEHVHTHIVDEIHPVIHREIVEQEVKLVEDHKKEHIIAPAAHINEVITENIVAPHHVKLAPVVESVPRHVDLAASMDHKTVVTDAVVEETIRKDLLTQVQPVVHKEVEVEEVHHITKHINEAPAPSLAGTVELAPVVQEHIHTTVIDEIHPILHREVVQQEVKLVEDHKKEHIVAPTAHINEVVTENIVAAHHVKLAPVVESVPRHVDLAASLDHKTVVTDAVVEETIRRDLLTQVQPVVHKEVEVEEVHHITKHINEARAPSVAGTVELAPVIQEHVHTHIVDEIHPVVHREIAIQEVERVEKHLTEHVRMETTHYNEVIVENIPAPAQPRTVGPIIMPGTMGLPSNYVHVEGDRHHVAHMEGEHHHVAHLEKERHHSGHLELGAERHHSGHIETVTDRHHATMLPVHGAATAGHNTIASDVVMREGVHHDSHMHKDAHLAKDPHHDSHMHKDAHLTKDIHHHDALHKEPIIAGKHTDSTLAVEAGGSAKHNHHVEAGGSAKHHHHLHLPHFLGGHKKDEHEVAIEKHDKHTVVTKH